MTTPPSGRLAANSFIRDLKRKLGCVESKTSTRRKKMLENKYLLGQKIGKGRFGFVRLSIVALHRSENAIEVSFQIGKDSFQVLFGITGSLAYLAPEALMGDYYEEVDIWAMLLVFSSICSWLAGFLLRVDLCKPSLMKSSCKFLISLKMVYKDPPLKKACQPRANEGEHQQRSPDIYFLIIVPHERLCQSSLLFKPNRNPKMLMLINSSHVFKKVVFGNDRKGNGGSISDVERAIPGLEIAPWLQI
ncbi:serine/threonine-protein kinase PEPKR2 [Canna indica]|uniref:Serine/threonine-protein kinase PEPKR2 n=1 Tax=Canna indica TaxID=4628 RepID=A0AAQ3QAH4_9LILI|nr:serine/threonine-protein kinase PEPKR2 [Canna indica]